METISNLLLDMDKNGIYMDANSMHVNYRGKTISTTANSSDEGVNELGNFIAQYQGVGAHTEAMDGDDDEEDDDDFEDEEEEEYGDDVGYENEDGDLMHEGGENGGQHNDDEEEDEDDYDNDYPDDQDEDTELETLENSYLMNSQKYDYATDNEEEKESPTHQSEEQIYSMAGGGLATVGPYQDEAYARGNQPMEVKVN